MILPYIDYGDIIYMGGNVNLLNKLQVQQNRELRVCLLVPKRFPMIELHIKCNTKLLTSRGEPHFKLLAHHYTRQKSLAMTAVETPDIRVHQC